MAATISERVKKLFADAPHGAQQKFADYSGFNRTALNNMLIRDNTKVPSEMIVPLSKYFGVSEHWLLTGENSDSSNDTPIPLMKIDATLVDLVSRLDREQQIELRGYVKHMLEESALAGRINTTA